MPKQNLPFLIAAFCLLAVFSPKSYSQTPPPVGSDQCQTFTFDATGSEDDRGDLEFLWDFGDGETSELPIIEHTYKKSGIYYVTLTVSDGSGLKNSSATTRQKIVVDIPPRAVFEAPDRVCAGDEFTLNANKSSDDAGALNYIWDFGDGTNIHSASSTIDKIYPKEGGYNVRLTVTDGQKGACHEDFVEKRIVVNSAPQADPGTEEILKCAENLENLTVRFRAQQSSDINNDKLTYEWEFGDGEKGSGVEVDHTYAQPGTYDAKLIVNDTTGLECSTDVAFVRVQLSLAPAAHAGDDVTACAGDDVVFDGSSSDIYKTGTATAEWDFGDKKSGRGLTTTHAYANPGQYEAKLTLTNQLNAMCPSSTDSRIVTINAPPTVTLRASEKGCVGETFVFDASQASDKDGDALEYYWTFGDGTVERAGAKVEHRFEKGGRYPVRVIVDDGRETACSTATAETVVKVNTPPVADAGASNICCVDEEAIFDASQTFDADHDKLTFSWDFGDGKSENGRVVYHTYKKGGDYPVTLTVDDNSGTSCSTSTATFTATANARPVPVIQIR